MNKKIFLSLLFTFSLGLFFTAQAGWDRPNDPIMNNLYNAIPHTLYNPAKKIDKTKPSCIDYLKKINEINAGYDKCLHPKTYPVSSPIGNYLKEMYAKNYEAMMKKYNINSNKCKTQAECVALAAAAAGGGNFGSGQFFYVCKDFDCPKIYPAHQKFCGDSQQKISKDLDYFQKKCELESDECGFTRKSMEFYFNENKTLLDKRRNLQNSMKTEKDSKKRKGYYEEIRKIDNNMQANQKTLKDTQEKLKKICKK